jgi:murein DD-endopeptidase MepM/ murein hydrolase activator NlpD
LSTFIYAPGCRVYIETVKDGIVDVTDDLVTGRINRVTGPSISQFQFSLKNPGRKYDGVFSTMDKITVQMKRIRWLQTFTGYLDTVPYFTVYASQVNMVASCTLKRLQFFVWDTDTQVAYTLLHGANGADTVINEKTPDGGMKQKTIDVLTKVVKWDKDGSTIHIGRIPDAWFTWAGKIAESVITAAMVENIGNTVGTGSTIAGKSIIGLGTNTVPSTLSLTGTIPNTSGNMGSSNIPENFDLTGEQQSSHVEDPWWCAMRFPYATVKAGGSDPAGSASDVSAAKNWWKNRKIIVENPKNGKGVVLRAACWGPIVKDPVRANNPDVIGASADALAAINIQQDEKVLIAFAPDSLPVGPTSTSDPLVSQLSATFLPPPTGSGNTGGQIFWPVPGYQTIGQKYGSHPGIDISAPYGTPMVAVADGTVIMAGPASGFGNWIVIQHDGFATVYGHMKAQDIFVTVGQNVSGGQEIALIDSMGTSTGDHLHIEVHPGSFQQSVRQDPEAFLQSKHAIDKGKVISPATSANTSAGATNSGDASSTDPIAPLFNLYQWQGSPATGFGDTLSGPRALMNDVPIMPTIDDLMVASQRSYCSAPNGDFIAWFPDYFGIFDTAAKMTIEDIELQDFQVMWTDQHFFTHEFVAGTTGTGLNISNQASAGATGDVAADTGQDIGASSETAMLTTSGIASVDFPEIMKALFGLENFDSAKFLARYGARPHFEAVPTITGGTTGTPVEFFFALYKFMTNWSQQWIARIPLTFMPELYPGMLIVIPKYEFQAYVEAVEHTFSFQEGGGGFRTTVTVSSYANTSKSKGTFPGLPKAGGAK